MDAHKAKIPDIVNNSTLIEVPFFSEPMFGKRIYGNVFLTTWRSLFNITVPTFLELSS